MPNVPTYIGTYMPNLTKKYLFNLQLTKRKEEHYDSSKQWETEKRQKNVRQ